MVSKVEAQMPQVETIQMVESTTNRSVAEGSNQVNGPKRPTADPTHIINRLSKAATPPVNWGPSGLLRHQHTSARPPVACRPSHLQHVKQTTVSTERSTTSSAVDSRENRGNDQSNSGSETTGRVVSNRLIDGKSADLMLLSDPERAFTVTDIAVGEGGEETLGHDIWKSSEFAKNIAANAKKEATTQAATMFASVPGDATAARDDVAVERDKDETFGDAVRKSSLFGMAVAGGASQEAAKMATAVARVTCLTN